MSNIILASKSPRRKELLERLQLDFEIVISDINEEQYTANDPISYVQKLAYEKAYAVSKRVRDDAIIIGCDTVVVYDNEIIEKPKDSGQACEFLERLSGDMHFVYSGLVLIDKSANKEIVTHEETKVFMRELSTEEIKSYVATKEPLDKAGAYGIQGIGSVLVDQIIGDYYNVMGLPIKKLYEGLEELGVKYFEIINI